MRLLNASAEIVVRFSSQQSSFRALLEEHFPGMAVVDPPALLTLKTFRSPEQIAGSESRSCFWQKGFHSSTLHRLMLLLWGRRRFPLQLTAAAMLVTLLVMGVPLFSQVGGWKQGLFVTLALLKGNTLIR